MQPNAYRKAGFVPEIGDSACSSADRVSSLGDMPVQRRSFKMIDKSVHAANWTIGGCAVNNSAAGRPGTDSMARIHEVFNQYRTVGLDANFFEAGLSSVTLVEIIDDLRNLGFTCSLIDLYHYPTIRELAAAVRSATAPATPDTLPWQMQAERRA
ncbi:acyl carrier protein [Nonomuraea sp. NPDC050786]|uniref:acyl carrier protein n=1 Tax=Nonomuraea sp. NPDC050786 TaxID=3154840 RepID=UPI003402F5D1